MLLRYIQLIECVERVQQTLTQENSDQRTSIGIGKIAVSQGHLVYPRFLT